MPEFLSIERNNEIATLRLKSPPVNGLSRRLREEFVSALDELEKDESVEALLFLSDVPGIFCGGADIVEFQTGAFEDGPYVPDVFTRLDAFPKLTVAAINGHALGGGCELALACDYRICGPQAVFGLPEASLGLLPGAGGTQRVQRIVSPNVAADMVVFLKRLGAEQAHVVGLADKLLPEKTGFEDGALAFTEGLLSEGAASRPSESVVLASEDLEDRFFEKLRARVNAKYPWDFARQRCVDALEAAWQTDYLDGLAREVEYFEQCLAHEQSRALQHVFFAERKVTDIPGFNHKTPPAELRSVGVVGAGTMGSGIAIGLLQAGMSVVMLELNDEVRVAALKKIKATLARNVDKGRMSKDMMESCLAALCLVADYDGLSDVDLVIEAVPERMDIKKSVFAALDRHCRPDVILASNTSSLSVTEIAQSVARPENVIGLHFFSPANIMRLLEVVQHDNSSARAIATSFALAKRMKKLPVVSRDAFGFIGNRLLMPYGREANRLILEGASPTDVDMALTEFGMAMGYCSVSDLAGIDVTNFVRGIDPSKPQDTDPSYCAIETELGKRGNLGQKTGLGFYRYDGGDKSENMEVAEIASAAASKFGISRRVVGPDEIVERAMLALMLEGLTVLNEGTAQRPSDIDLVLINGYGFPAWRGGPMKYASERGEAWIRERLAHYRGELGAYGLRIFPEDTDLSALFDAEEKGK